MIKEVKRKLTLDRPVTYQIKVPGHLDASWTEWNGRMTVTVEYEADGRPVTTLTGTIDQAALHGLLRRLYSLGLPLISVICLDYMEMTSNVSIA
jgi:hypothetical protein